MTTQKTQAIQIKEWAHELGFLACGFATAERLSDNESQLDQWLNNNFHGNMQYMENYREMRLDPTIMVPGAKTVISLAFNYYPESPLAQQSHNTQNRLPFSTDTGDSEKSTPLIAKYAWGDDYHHVIKDKLFVLMERIKSLEPTFEGRAFVDSAPVMERQWAVRAGLGWIGKNSLLLRKGVGSFFFLAEIIVNIELPPDTPQTDHCGECTACIDACPTQAIVQPQVIDSRKCISYLTIEDKSWPTDANNRSRDRESLNTGVWAYGCDVCQDVCPWNRFSTPHNEPQFNPRDFIHWSTPQWEEVLREPARMKPFLKNSAMQRAGLKKLAAQITLALNLPKDFT